MATKLYATATLTGNTALLSTSATTAATATKNAGRVGTSSNTWLIASGTASTSTHPVTSPSRGAQWKVTTLSGQTVPAGKWTLSFQVKPATTAAGTLVGSWKVALFRKNGTTNTNIGTLTKVGGTITSGVFTTITVTGTLGAITFAAGTQLAYLIYFTGHSGTASTGNTKFRLSVGGALQSITFPFTPASPVRGLVMPTVRTQIALTGGLWNPGNWVDIGPFVTGFSLTRGRQHELQRAEAGELQLDLINTDGRFSTYNTNSPYYNQLSATDSAFTAGVGTWTGTAGTLATSATHFLYGTQALRVTTTAATGAVSAATSHTAYAVTAGRTYTALLSVQALAAYTACNLKVSWYKSTGTLISSTTSASAVASHTAFTQYLVRAVAPALAAFVQLSWVGTSTGTSQQYWIDCAGLFDVTYVTPAAVAQGWTLGQRKALNPAMPVKITATWTGVTYPVFMGIISTWVPKWSPALGTLQVTAYDYMHILALMPAAASTYAYQVRTDGANHQYRLGTRPGTGKVYDSIVVSGGTPILGTAFGVTFAQPGGLTGTPGTSAQFVRTHPHGNPHFTTAEITAPIGTPGSAWSGEFLFKTPATTGTQTGNLLTIGTPGTTGYIAVTYGWTATASAFKLGLAAFVTGITTGGFIVTGLTLAASTWHHVVVIVTGTKAKLYIDGVKRQPGPTAGGTFTINAARGTGLTIGGYYSSTTVAASYDVQEVATYAFALSAATITLHYTDFAHGLGSQLSGKQIKAALVGSGVPASAIGTISTGTVVCQGPAVTLGQTQLLSVIQTAEATEGGFLYCAETGKIEYVTVRYIEGNSRAITSNATFADDLTPAHFKMATPPVPALDDLTLWNTVPVSVQGTSAVTYYAITLTSQTANGRRILTGYTGMYFSTPIAAQRLATKLCVTYAQPLTRVRSITVNSLATTGKNFPQMLGRHLLDAITVRWQPIDGTASPFVQTSQIEQVVHTVTKTTWTTTWALTPIVPWFILNHSVYGVLAGAGSTAANRLGV